MVVIVPHGSVGNINICNHSPRPLFCCLSAQGNRGIMHVYLDISLNETLKDDKNPSFILNSLWKVGPDPPIVSHQKMEETLLPSIVSSLHVFLHVF